MAKDGHSVSQLECSEKECSGHRKEGGEARMQFKLARQPGDRDCSPSSVSSFTMAKSGEAALFSWAQNNCAAYGLSIKNFTKDWADGRAFCALVGV